MTFDEFFKKKRIDLPALEKAEPALFSEFKTHYEQMGEKSFDHTKKYWFNKLRRQYPFAPEVKTEKAHISNPLAEQTITESLTESASTATPPQPSPKVGFVPRFKAGGTAKPPVNVEDKKEETLSAPVAATEIPEQQPAEEAEVKPSAYQPRFKMKPKAEKNSEEPKAEEPVPEEKPAAKPAYKPRFVPPKPKD